MSKELVAKEKKTKALHDTVDTLWADRLERYKQTNINLHSYIVALPEAIGALKGLTNHYRYMSEEMRKFVNFDVACSKVHHLALLLDHGGLASLPSVAPTLQRMFRAEPLIDVVCENMKELQDVQCPSSVAEASSLFTYCMGELDDAVEKASKAYFQFSENPRHTPSVAADSMHKLTNLFKIDTLSHGQRELVKKRALLDRLLIKEKRQLHTVEDVRAALDHVERVKEKFGQPAKKSFFFKDDDHQVSLQRDLAVTKAVKQLELWKSVTATFLLQEQAREALQSYSILLSETLTKVNKT
ncbi:hypothetical protein STCU_07942 [Strigomonas culicis]|nr:hypothetical protein STCU_07942 [Strigomonas culicis]|eukprot:EPY23016.1 hypothetical protein STCU_07942 [Strigomonas culicis]